MASAIQHFTYGRAHVDREQIAVDETVTISADMTNTGSMPGDEVVQLYMTHEGIKSAALHELRGFQRIHLNRGKTKTVAFTLHDVTSALWMSLEGDASNEEQ
jgi:beta-glucosidase